MILQNYTVHCDALSPYKSPTTSHSKALRVRMTVEHKPKKKVIFVLGATATGKSRMSIDIAKQYPAEIINSDKIQMYKGLDIITNKLNYQDMNKVPHHLLSILDDPNADYTTTDFCYDATFTIESILKYDRLPIVVGGSNSFIEALVEHNPQINFKKEYDPCFIWMDVSAPILFSRICTRVDEMIDLGLIDELCQLDFSSINFRKGIFRSIGVEELKNYFLAKKYDHDEEELNALLQKGIDQMKLNTCRLAAKQAARIRMMAKAYGWKVHRIDVSDVYRRGGDVAERVWVESVKPQGLEIVKTFLGSGVSDSPRNETFELVV